MACTCPRGTRKQKVATSRSSESVRNFKIIFARRVQLMRAVGAVVSIETIALLACATCLARRMYVWTFARLCRFVGTCTCMRLLPLRTYTYIYIYVQIHVYVFLNVDIGHLDNGQR